MDIVYLVHLDVINVKIPQQRVLLVIQVLTCLGLRACLTVPQHPLIIMSIKVNAYHVKHHARHALPRQFNVQIVC